MSERFKNSRDRVKRATYHSRALDAEWRSILGGESTRTTLCEKKYPGWLTLIASLTDSARDRLNENTLSLELGEFAYQLRAALDGLMWDALTHIQGSEPPADAAARLEFPITRSDKEFKNRGFHAFPYPDELVRWLESIQPYAAVKPVGDPDRGLNVTLEDVHNLARMDRHRRLRIVAAVPKNVRLIPITVPPGGSIVAHEWLPCDLFSGEDELAKIKIECAGGMTPFEVRLKAHVSFEILIENVEMYNGEGVGEQLRRFAQAVVNTILRFEKEFP